MKILHTADWHIGKQLKKQSLNAELELFFKWLSQTLSDDKYDLLLVSGDIFDSYNPKAIDRNLYYRSLAKLSNSVGRIIITGGNHDSIAVLDAPTAVLDSLNISIVAGAKDDLSEELFEITVGKGETCIVAAIPYLRDRDVLTNQTFDNDQDRPSQIREGYEQHYRSVYEIAKKKYSKIPLIGMGHLYTTGAQLSESERDIQVGNQGAVEAKIFTGYDYLALGHIHRPQRVNKMDHIRYSGSPVALSFSEKSDKKEVVKIEIVDGKIQEISSIELPQFRQIISIKGTISEVQDALGKFKKVSPLEAFIEVTINEEVRDLSIIPHIEEVISQFNQSSTQGKILKHSIQFAEASDSNDSLFKTGKQIDDLTHIEVFNELLDLQSQNPESRHQLIATYIELAENYQDYLDETA